MTVSQEVSLSTRDRQNLARISGVALNEIGKVAHLHFTVCRQQTGREKASMLVSPLEEKSPKEKAS